jgi:aspartate aminotransferase-like enzyme
MTAVASIHPLYTPLTASTDSLTYKVASEADEIEQVHQLNYRTFVEEIPQHRENAERALVDKFHGDNIYIVAKRGTRVVGMMALREQRPFSLDAKLENLDSFLPPGLSLCEIRLLAVEPEFRNGVVFRGLATAMMHCGVSRGFNAAVISGTTRQRRLYAHLGFVPFGPLVGTSDAAFQPMYITLDALRTRAGETLDRAGRPHTASFLPGPVDLHPRILEALASPAISHRDATFVTALRRTKKLLCRLTLAQNVEILVGSGTLANDVVAAQLAALQGPGLVLSNGEFGERLVDHASRAGLRFVVERLDWGRVFDVLTLDRAFAAHRGIGWCWMVHHETSTGVLNYLAHATRSCSGRGVKLAVDCVSSVGLVPVDLSGVHLATAVSGKALASAPGLSMVFHRDAPERTRAPRYLDLSMYAAGDGVPFTTPSQQLAALRIAAERAQQVDFDRLRALSSRVREALRSQGARLIAHDEDAAPGIVTFVPPHGGSAVTLGDVLASAGFALSYRSDYLRERNWIQIALMGECSDEKVERLLQALTKNGNRA